MPVAATVKVAVAPAGTLWLCGCMVMVGATGLTVSEAAWLVTLPPVLVTVTLKLAPLFASVVAGVV